MTDVENIDIKDIQLGNTVFYLSLSEGDVFYTEVNKDVYDMIYKDPENWYPVDLTEKELKILGFEKDVLKTVNQNNEEIEQVSWESPDKRVIMRKDYLNSNNEWYVHVDTQDMSTQATCELTYLHQLQNFLRICGIEYEFKV